MLFLLAGNCDWRETGPRYPVSPGVLTGPVPRVCPGPVISCRHSTVRALPSLFPATAGPRPAPGGAEDLLEETNPVGEGRLDPGLSGGLLLPLLRLLGARTAARHTGCHSAQIITGSSRITFSLHFLTLQILDTSDGNPAMVFLSNC